MFGSLRFVARAHSKTREILGGLAAPGPEHDGKTHTHTKTHTSSARITTHPLSSHVHAENSHRAKNSDMFSPSWSLNGGRMKRRRRRSSDD